jgi:hypothetical protein
MLALPMLFFAVEAEAGVCSGMLGEGADEVASKINVVTSVKVNGLEWAEFDLDWTRHGWTWAGVANSQQWRETCMRNGVSYEDHDGEEVCTPFHTVTVSCPDKIIQLIYVGYPKDTKFDQDFWQSNEYEVNVDIDWKPGQFKDLLVVGEHTIRPDLNFEAFKKLFPFSAKQSVAALVPEWHERKNDAQTYIIEVNSNPEPGCLDRIVEFTFTEGQLSHLALRNYPTWCSC